MKSSPRRRAREFAVQGLYQTQLNRMPAAEIARDIRESRHFAYADEELFGRIFNGAQANETEYAAIIRPLLDRDEKHVHPIERAVLLMAVYELKEMPETPYPVIINEAIEITKTFGGTDGHKFVNGILDKLAAQLRPNDPKRS